MLFFWKAYVYEPDSEEGSLYADLTSSLNNSAHDTETDGTVTPIPKRKIKNSEFFDESSSNLNEKFKKYDNNELESLTESEYFTAQSGIGTDSMTSSSIWK